MTLTVASLFAGIGGLDLGFQWAGARVVWASDICPIAAASYKLNFERPALQANVLDLDIATIPNTDVIIGGPPCQSFSLVGLRRPDDQRGELVFRFAEIIEAKRPAGFVMENVPGLAATRVGGVRLTEHLAERFARLGYYVTTMKLNAADYMVPQLRKRVFIVGSLVSPVSIPDPREFAQSTRGVRWSGQHIGSGAAISDLGEPVGKGLRAKYRGTPASDFASWMRGMNQDVSLHVKPRMSETDSRLVRLIPPGGNYQDVPDEYATQRILNFKRTGGRTSTYGRLHPLRPAFTVNTYFRRPNVGANFHPFEDRLITVREAMRLQSLPDWFEIAQMGAQDARNALVGNAVPPLMAQAVAREVLNSIGVTPAVAQLAS
ncbi:Modification methylase HaeIII [compost metagenome]